MASTMKTIVVMALMLALVLAAQSAEAGKRVSKRAAKTTVMSALQQMANLDVPTLQAAPYTTVISTCNGLSLFQCAQNAYSKLSSSRFAQLYLNHDVPAGCLNMTEGRRYSDPARVERITRTLPTTLNYATDGSNRVTAVKDQSGCGSCWCFAAVGALEFMTPGYTLSEQHCINCAVPPEVSGSSGSFDVCGNGGIFTWMFEYSVHFMSGRWAIAQSVPYTGTPSTCNTNLVGQQQAYTNLHQYKIISSGDEASLMVALNTVATATVMDGSHPFFQHYNSGVYIDPDCSDTIINHGVLLVGYNNDPSTPIPYWIAKNSYGTTWGNGGYFNIVMWLNMCGIATYASYPVDHWT